MKALVLLVALVPATASAGIYNSLSGSVTHDCSKDPDVVINASDGSVTLTGTCDRVVVNGGEVKLQVEAVKRMVVNGAENTVAIGAVDRLSVVGADNTVTYKRGISGQPKVASIGANNKITQVK